ncbi:competence protein F [Leifsonia xyli subsp. cynodontis DSM 46306]|uniref:Phosphoribosyltransferase domain-containing protein n=1 Tax=Leifsonia xyli subsp. cynodontis DSM 46306 TaxID=1389489 RepID=U3P9K6_LEIXC|nr:phosphoribosyltransferase family protein [Leifsonia xyli]AGW42209.1 competence protein F [Leifsonia xyli subsp. cynodontis DSM 46306]
MTKTSLKRPVRLSLARSAVLDAAGILLPVRCAGCGAGDRSVCSVCERALSPEVAANALSGLPIWSALRYDRAARRILLAFKDGDRTDAATFLARSLRPAVAEAQRAMGPASTAAAGAAALLPVLIPSTRSAWRRRGYHPTGMLLSRSRMLVPPLWRALRLARQTADQAGLPGNRRAENRAGSMSASPRLAGRRCLIVDDILTTGATVTEAARAIAEAGGEAVGAVTLARTPLRGGPQGSSVRDAHEGGS